MSGPIGGVFDVESVHFEDEQCAVDRVRLVLSLYSLWMENHRRRRHQELNHGLSPRELMDDGLSGSSYDWTRFMTDYRRICGLKRDLVDDEEGGCDVARCAVIGRNERNRAFYGKNESLRNEMYLIESGQSMEDEVVDEEERARNIATQQILDSLHSFFYHSVHFDDGDFEGNAVEDEDDEMENDIDFETLCDDHSAEKLLKTMEQKRSGSNRFRSRKRGSANEPQQSEHHKFVTTNDFEAGSSSSFSAVYGGKRQRCFRGVFVSEMERHGVSEDAVRSLIEAVQGQQFDTDAMVGDLADLDHSNLAELVAGAGHGDAVKFGDVAAPLILEKTMKDSLYSPGVRYFYWSHYRGNTAKRRVYRKARWQPMYEENRGYTLGQWFVEKKYGNLKDELLNNLVLTLSAGQFAVTLRKATDKLAEWRASGKQPRCRQSWWRESYGVEYGQSISIEHIMAILLYCNFSDLCYIFSSTFRKIHDYESDEDMLSRHREYAIWARLLREAVECFGTAMVDSDVKMFYHGVSCTLFFDSTSVHLCGPVSTTSSMFLDYVSVTCPSSL